MEAAANGHAVLDTLTHVVPGLVGVTPEGGKRARAEAAMPVVQAGQVHLPHPEHELTGRSIAEHVWVYDFVDQLCMFPHGEHDDDVDAFTQGLAQFRKQSAGDAILEFWRQQAERYR